MNRHSVCLLFLPTALLAFSILNERFWTFEPISIKTSTSDESKLKSEFRIVRIRRGVFALSGELVWNFDIDEQTTVEVLMYRSRSGGESDYWQLPLGVPRQPFYDFINNVYKDVTVRNFANCSNLPQFEGKFEPPWPKRNYTFDRCMMTGEGFPFLLPEGFYKLLGTIDGEAVWKFDFVALVTPKSE